MKRYFQIFISLTIIALKSFLDNRVNFVMGLLVSLINLVFSIFFVSVIFIYTKELNGWNKYEVLALMGLYRIIGDLFDFWLKSGVTNLGNIVRRGDLDLMLIKPFSAQFMVSFSQVRIGQIFDVFGGVILLVYSLSMLGYQPSVLGLIFLVFNIVCGVVILYSLIFMIATFAIWFGNFTSINQLAASVREPLQVPLSVYGPDIQFVLTVLVPMAFIVMVPAEVLLGKSPVYWVLIEFSVSLVMIWLSTVWWKYSLRHYTSASS